MTCEKCLHKDVCRDNDSNYCEKGGAEHCYYFIEAEVFITNAIKDLITKLSKAMVDSKK